MQIFVPKSSNFAIKVARVMKKIVEGEELNPPAVLKKKDIGFNGYDLT